MNILFLTRHDPANINNWSGTSFHVYHQLIKKHHVAVMGVEILGQLYTFVRNFPESFFIPTDRYIKNLGRLLSERMNHHNFDLLFWGDIIFHPWSVDIPFVSFSDMTFEQKNIHLKKEDERNVAPCIHLEKMMLNRSNRIIYCSE